MSLVEQQTKSFAERKPVILAVDDDPNNLSVIRDCLVGFNYTVLAAEDGESALARAVYAHPDLILLDIMMPGIDGFETCRRLKSEQRTKDIPVMFMTALAETEHKIKGLAAGAVDYITKPFHQEELLARIDVHLQIRELTQRLKEANESLERRVEERTLALAQANVELEEEICERQAVQEMLQEQAAILEEEIAERQLAQEALLQSEKKFRAIFHQAFQFIGLLKPDGAMLEANQTSLDFCGADAAAVTDIAFWETPWWSHSPELREKVREAVRKAAKGEFVRFEVTHRALDGSIHVFDFSLKPVMNESGNVKLLIPEGRDITEYRKLEEQLRQSRKLEAIGSLAGGVAHDFNNLLTPIMGYADIIQRSLPGESPLLDKARGILKAAESAKGLTSQLLSFGRKQVLDMRLVELNEIIGSFHNILRRTIRENIDIRVTLTPEGTLIKADKGQIEQILLNLAINAMDSITETGTISIETSRITLNGEAAGIDPGMAPGMYVMLLFSDSGSGMNNDTLSHIFEPFFTTKQAGHGTGLGLATVYGIAKQHCGFIQVTSSVGQGTTFRIYIPIHAGRQENDSPHGAASRRYTGSGTILVVEDNEMVRGMVVDILADAGFTVYAAGAPHEAFPMVEQLAAPIDLLVTDVIMPGMNGQEFYELLVRTHQKLKVIYISGYAHDVNVHCGPLGKEATFIAKPFTADVLLEKVKQVL